jgi:hypothetical protein
VAYATVDQLAAALRVPVSAANTAALQTCLDAAAEEIDHAVARLEPIPDGDPLAERVNILRGVEWFKANDAAFGILGFDETALRTPRNSFLRHRSALVPLKQQWGVA